MSWVRRILASILMSVDVTEVFSPAIVNKLAAKFGLLPGASLDLTNGWDFRLASDRNRAWKLVKTSVSFVVIGSPLLLYSLTCRKSIRIYIATTQNG